MVEDTAQTTFGQQQVTAVGPVTAAQVLKEFEQTISAGTLSHLQPLATGFLPLDDVLNGGMRPGELMVIGGPFGVGKTILALQIARNVAIASPDNQVIYICYEHSRKHLLSRLICLESAEQNDDDPLTLRKLAQLSGRASEATGPINFLRQDARYAKVMSAIDSYADRLILAKASGIYTTLGEISQWLDDIRSPQAKRVLVVVDYLQKVPVNREVFRSEDEATTVLTQGLKDLALTRNLHMIAIAASDRFGLKSKRMRLSDLRGSSALQYETDIGLVLNRKYDIVSREHLIYNLAQADSLRQWIVLSMEKNRAGLSAVDMEHAMDAAHFRFDPKGQYVRERLVDNKAILE